MAGKTNTERSNAKGKASRPNGDARPKPKSTSPLTPGRQDVNLLKQFVTDRGASFPASTPACLRTISGV